MDKRTLKRRDFLKSAGLLTAQLALTGGTATADGDNEDAKPNILWITCEDISPYLGCYGDIEARTPNVDKLASQGTRYTNAYATAPVCAPSRSCIITGVYATSLGTQHLRSLVEIPKKIKCFTQYLREAGYYCTNNDKKDYNFVDVNAWDESSKEAHWRKRKPGRPFFSVFNFISTHQGQINGPDAEFNEKYRSKLRPEELHKPEDIELPPYYPDTPMVRKIWARYYDLITYMDHQVEDLLAQLDADGLTENTIVFFYSDHGMGLPRFKRTLYDSGLHIPLIIRFPEKYKDLAPTQAGGTTDRLVSFVDFAPTILSLLDMPIPSYMQGTAFLGGRTGKPREYIYATSSRVDEAYDMARCVRDKRYKYIRNFLPNLPYIQPSFYCDQAEIMQELRHIAAEGNLNAAQKPLWEPTRPREELYDTQADPHESENLADVPQYRNILAKMRVLLKDWMIDTRDTGLMPEAEMHIRAEGSTPYEVAHDPQKYPIERIMAAADLVGKGPENLKEMLAHLKGSDPAERYWAALAIAALGKKAEPAMQALRQALSDEAPNVRFTAAGAVCKFGDCDKALEVFAKGLQEPREETVLAAAREIQMLGEEACSLKEQMLAARARCKGPDGQYKNLNHAWFIDEALKSALANCKQRERSRP
jgi:arylsulfatase A-like enzyme